MKPFTLKTIVLIILLVWPSLSFAEDPGPGTPSALVKEPVYTFPSTVEGAKISHDFAIDNTGQSTLVIEKVQPTCGCTTTSFTKKIEPGQSGVVKTLLRTDGQGGRHIKKAVKVYTNDPKHTLIPLTLTGDITSFADVSSSYIRFPGVDNDRNEKRITIKPLAGSPFTIKDVTVLNKKELAVTWSQIENGREKLYEIVARNLKKDPGRIQNRIIVHTDSPVKPEIIIRVGGFVREDTHS